MRCDPSAPVPVPNYDRCALYRVELSRGRPIVCAIYVDPDTDRVVEAAPYLVAIAKRRALGAAFERWVLFFERHLHARIVRVD